MLRKTLIAAVLLGASGSTLAWDEVISRPRVSIDPHVTITLGHAHHTPPREVYYRDVYREVYVPQRVVQPVYNSYYYRQDEGYRHWGNRDRHEREWRRHDRDDHHGRRGHHRDDDDD